MTWTPAFTARVTYNVLRESAHRTATAGPRSGWACFKTHAMNFYVRALNKLASAPAVECPCCGWTGVKFRAIDCGKFVVPDAECPRCGGHERHRMIHLFLTRRPPAFMNGDGWVLHFAPEQQVRGFVLKNPNLRCLSTDYDPEMVRYVDPPAIVSDIRQLPFRDNAIDGLYCIHVLEHVRFDDRAIAELHRVMKPGHDAILMVPFMMDQTETFEYPEPDPNMYYHVRGYSPLDFKHRLGPFGYEEVKPASFMTPDEIQRYAVPDSQVIYVCRKTPT